MASHGVSFYVVSAVLVLPQRDCDTLHIQLVKNSDENMEYGVLVLLTLAQEAH